MTERDVVIRISAKNLTAKEFQAARKQLDDLGKKAGLTNTGFGQMGKGFQNAAAQLSSFNPTAARATSLLSGFGAAGLAAGVAIGGVGAAVGFGVKSLVEMGDRLTKLSRTTTISTDALQRMEAFGRPLGITLEQMAGASNKLDKALGTGGAGVNKALGMLNLSLDELSSMTADERLRTVQIAVSKLKNPLDQAFAGSTLLSKSWAELRLDPASIEEGTRALDGLIVVSKEALEAGDALGDSWADLWANMKATAAEDSKDIVKSLNSIVEALGDFTKEWKEAGEEQEKTVAILNDANRRVRESFEGGGTLSFADAKKEAEKYFGITQRVAKFQSDADKKRLDDLKKIQAGQRALTDEEQREIDKLAKLHEKAAADQAKAAKKLFNEQISSVQDLDKAIQALAASEESGMNRLDNLALGMAESWASTKDEIQGVIDLLESDIINQSWGGLAPDMSNIPAGIASGLDLTVGIPSEELDEFGLSLEAAADIAQIFGDQLGGFGEALIQGAASADLIFSGKAEGGFAGAMKIATGAALGFAAVLNATASGTQGQRAAGGALSGAQTGAAVAPPGFEWAGALIGAGVGALVGWARGRGPAQVGEDAGRNIGVALSQALMEEIHKSGENAQMFLAEIWAEGGLGIDRFAEEVGDLFSMFARGEISKETLIGELKETLPILIEHFQELGPEGQEQLERIISAAEAAGVSIDELGEIIALTLDDDEVLAIVEQLGVTQAAADALGISFDQLGEKIQSIFAPETLETLAENFGKTTEEMRQILADLGINVQTDLERLAAEAGLSVEDFKALGAALEEATGIPAEKLSEFLAETGQSAAELAAALGVDVSESLGTVNEEAAGAAAEIGLGADEAARLADELERAARAAANINVGGIPGFDTGGGIPETGAQHGFHGDVTGPHRFVIEPGVRERVDIGPAGSGSGGMTVQVTVDARGSIGLDGDALANKIVQLINDNTAGIATRTGIR